MSDTFLYKKALKTSILRLSKTIRMKSRILIFFTFLLILSCSTDPKTPTTNTSKALDTWVFRSVLDGIPRMITAQLDDDFFVAYNTQTASMYKAWKGIVNYEGAVYDGAHGPQPAAVGDAYLKYAPDHRSWYFKNSGDEVTADIEYRGHKMSDGGVELMYTIINPTSKASYDINERIRFKKTEGGDHVLSRTFIPQGNASGDAALHLKANAIVVDKSRVTLGKNASITQENPIDYKDKKYFDYSIDLQVASTENDDDNKIEVQFNAPTIIDPNLTDGFDTDDTSLPPGAQLIGKHDCRTCHNSQKKTIGPAYVSIAKKYEHSDDNALMLVNKIKKGGSGIWGPEVMTPHPEISDFDLKEMVGYIFSLAEYEGTKGKKKAEVQSFSNVEVKEDDMVPGFLTRVYSIPSGTELIPTNLASRTPIMAGMLPNLDNLSGGDFKDLEEDFAMLCEGYFIAEKDGNYEFRLWSDDGSKLYLHNKLIVDHDGLHGTSMKQNKVQLKKGYHPFKIEFHQAGGGKFLSFNFKPEKEKIWRVVPPKMLAHDKAERTKIGGLSLPMSSAQKIPGDGNPVAGMHPSFDLSQARPDDFNPKVGGMDFLPDGRLLVSTWDQEGAIYVIDNTESDNPEDITYKKIAQGLAEPLGVNVVGDRIFIMQKQELTELVDTNGDDIIDEYRTHCDDWGVSNNFHEFGFGLAEKDGYLYFNLASGILPGGAGMPNQHPDRGSCMKVSVADGSMEKFANGLRTPNGIDVGYGGDIFIADNQGDWLPSSKILHATKGAWFGSRAVDFEGTEGFKEKLPVVWLPQDEIGNSPTTPLSIDVGPYKNQMIHSEVTHGGVKRVFVEEVNDQLQGCVFRFMQGMEGGVNRIKWAPDGKTLYGGCIGNPGNWQHSGQLWFGLQKMKYNEKSTFEMLAIRAKSDGVEIEFTEPLKEGEGWSSSDYEIKQWYYKPTADYGGPKLDERNLNVKSVNISDDRTKVFLELDGMKENHVIYVHLKKYFVSDNDNSLWSTEGWYTMNYIPKNNPGFKVAAPPVVAANTLTAKEKADGWSLLFDGKSLDNFHTFKTDAVDNKWTIEGDAIAFDPTREGNGGDLVTNNTYEDFELKLEWKISNCGNSGIMFNLQESDDYCCTWWTGPEMQILDNTCHPDTKYESHRAGCLYDMIVTKFVTVKPAGEWNEVSIKSKNKEVEFWMNGYKVVEFTMGNEKWNEMIANSKFKDMEGFGQFGSGRIAFQDHADKVWFRNMKIRKL